MTWIGGIARHKMCLALYGSFSIGIDLKFYIALSKRKIIHIELRGTLKHYQATTGNKSINHLMAENHSLEMCFMKTPVN